MWSNPQETADLIAFTKEILNGKLHFLYSVCYCEDYCQEDLKNLSIFCCRILSKTIVILV